MSPTRVFPILLLALYASLGAKCGSQPSPLAVGRALFASPQSNPLALSGDGVVLYVANAAAGTLSVLDVSNPTAPQTIAEVHVGLEPVSVAARPKLDPGDPLEDELVFVSNHLSDSVSVVSRDQLAVVQTLQALDGDGVSTTNEPVGVAFAGSSRAFVALDEPNQVLVVDVDAQGHATISPTRLDIAGQAPRALTVAGGRLYVAAFESGNQTEFPSCAPADPRGLDPQDPFDEGCEFHLDQATLLSLNRTSRGGRVIRDGDLPDRDLFVFDATSLAPIDVIEGVGTLLYGVAAGDSGDRIFVTNTEARNHRNGLLELGNRPFENRLAYIDCAQGCASHAPPVNTDLDALAAIPTPTPYGVAVSGDGNLVAVTVAGSDGSPGIPADLGVTLPGLVLLDGGANFLGRIPLDAVPQGVALRSDPAGLAEWAFVLNSLDATVSVVDLANPAAPVLAATLPVGSDPTPASVRRGRVAFNAARASTSGRFSCESCHPHGNVDQLLWTINALGHPDDGPDANGIVAEPRNTQPVRGLRGTLPLHWDGSLGDSLSGTIIPGDTAPDCDLANGELTCFRHLVDASLAGVMCDPAGCPVGPSGLPGALTDPERDDLASYLMAVSIPPSPARRPSGALSAAALAGARDFLTPDNGLGFPSTPDYTCARPGSGCHELPLLAGTNNHVAGGDAPSMRGIWDRVLLFSSGYSQSQEALALAQSCADGTGPVDPCFSLLLGGATFDFVWDPAIGMTERGSFMTTINLVDRFVRGVRGPETWSYFTEMSVGFPSLVGRQVSLTPTGANDSAVIDAMDQIEQAVSEQRLAARAAGPTLGLLGFDATTKRWRNVGSGPALTGQELRDFAAAGEVVTLTAWPPRGVALLATRQPLVWPEVPPAPGGAPAIPRPPAGGSATLQLAHADVKPTARVLVDGSVCASCTLLLTTAPGGEPRVEILLDPVPAAGPHMLQVANRFGLESNELLFIAE